MKDVIEHLRQKAEEYREAAKAFDTAANLLEKEL